MDTIKTLCEGQSSETRRRILAAYYRGCADGLRELKTATNGRPEHSPLCCFRGTMFHVLQSRSVHCYEVSNRWYLSPLRGTPKSAAQTILFAMPCGLDARMAKNAPADRRTKIQRQRAILRQHLSPARQADPEAVSGMRGQAEPDAPRGLQQAAGGDVAVQTMPYGSAQAQKSRIRPLRENIGLLRNQAD